MKEDGAWVGLILHDLLKATVLSGLEGGDLFIGFWIFIGMEEEKNLQPNQVVSAEMTGLGAT